MAPAGSGTSRRSIQAALRIDLNGTPRPMSASDKVERLAQLGCHVSTTEKTGPASSTTRRLSRVDVARMAQGAAVRPPSGSTRPTTRSSGTSTTLQIPACREIPGSRMGRHAPPAAGSVPPHRHPPSRRRRRPPDLLEYIRRNNVYNGGNGPAARHPARCASSRTPPRTGGGRMVVYAGIRKFLRFHLPMPPPCPPAAPEVHHGFETGIIARTGGTQWRLPGAACYGDEITRARLDTRIR